MEKILLKLPEVSEITGLGRTKIYQLAREGTLPVVRIGRSVRVPASELNHFLERLRSEQSDDTGG